ncbi:MAG TPA: hypothetical protein VF324_06595 [Methanobacterium sp.]
MEKILPYTQLDLAPDSYYDYYTKNYEEAVNYYDKLEDLRIKFANKQISKEEFLNKVEKKTSELIN